MSTTGYEQLGTAQSRPNQVRVQRMLRELENTNSLGAYPDSATLEKLISRARYERSQAIAKLFSDIVTFGWNGLKKGAAALRRPAAFKDVGSS